MKYEENLLQEYDEDMGNRIGMMYVDILRSTMASMKMVDKNGSFAKKDLLYVLEHMKKAHLGFHVATEVWYQHEDRCFFEKNKEH